MIKTNIQILLTLLLGMFIGQQSVRAQECKNLKILQSVSASASSWENLRNNPGSLRFESARLLKEGSAVLNTDSDASASKLILDSSPKKFLSDYSDSEYCQQKLQATTQKPIKFNPAPFASIEDLSSWFSDFSQGSGAEGKELYAICDKTCSPQYRLETQKKGQQLIVSSLAICGHARDKSDGMYNLCTGIK